MLEWIDRWYGVALGLLSWLIVVACLREAWRSIAPIVPPPQTPDSDI